MALWGEKFHPMIGVFSSPPKLENRRIKGVNPPTGLSPNCAGHPPTDVPTWAKQHPTSHPRFSWSMPVHPFAGQWGLSGTTAHLRRRGKRCWDMAPSQLSQWWKKHWGTHKGVLLRRFPADKTGNSQCAPQLVWLCSSLLCYSLETIKYSSSLSSLVRSPVHTATPPNMTTKKRKKRGTQL